MTIRFVLLVSACCAAAAAVVWWRAGHTGVSPQELLTRDDLTQTKVTYHRTRYFALEGCGGGVSAEFCGDGTAVLRLRDRAPVTAGITAERYRMLLQTMADNDFPTIGVRRRWGVFLADFGTLDIAIEAEGRKSAICVDEKHYTAAPERLEAILEAIYSFSDEFGCEFAFGPVATTAVQDSTERTAVISGVAAVVLLCGAALMLWRVRNRRN